MDNPNYEMEIDPRPLMPGDRVIVFDHTIFKDDKTTPLSMTLKPATIIRRYGQKCYYPVSEVTYIYPDLIDVDFDHRGESKGHFTTRARTID